MLAAEETIWIIRTNDRFANPAAGWADIGMYLFFDSPDCDGVVAEIQIVHQKLMLVREQMGAHDSYDTSRCASELLRTKLIDWTVSKQRWSQLESEDTPKDVVLPVNLPGSV